MPAPVPYFRAPVERKAPPGAGSFRPTSFSFPPDFSPEFLPESLRGCRPRGLSPAHAPSCPPHAPLMPSSRPLIVPPSPEFPQVPPGVSTAHPRPRLRPSLPLPMPPLHLPPLFPGLHLLSPASASSARPPPPQPTLRLLSPPSASSARPPPPQPTLRLLSPLSASSARPPPRKHPEIFLHEFSDKA